MEKKNLDYQFLLDKQKKTNERCENLQEELNYYKASRIDLINDNSKNQKLLLNEKKNNSGDNFFKKIKFITIIYFLRASKKI